MLIDWQHWSHAVSEETICQWLMIGRKNIPVHLNLFGRENSLRGDCSPGGNHRCRQPFPFMHVPRMLPRLGPSHRSTPFQEKKRQSASCTYFLYITLSSMSTRIPFRNQRGLLNSLDSPASLQKCPASTGGGRQLKGGVLSVRVPHTQSHRSSVIKTDSTSGR